MIDIRNFVNVNIKPAEKTGLDGSRSEVLVYGTANKVTIASSSTDYSKFYDDNSSEITTLSTDEKTLATIFFKNGGVRLKFTGSTIPTSISAFEDIDLLENIIVVNEGSVTNYDDNDWESLGIHQKIIIEKAMTNDAYKSLENHKESRFEIITIADTTKGKGAEMAIAAYLSSLDVYEENPDYDMTKIYGVEDDESKSITSISKSLADIKYNFPMKKGNSYYMIGGNCTDGSSLVNNFAIIVLSQNVSDRVFDVLSSKVSGQTGLSAIATVVADELNKYYTSGLLTSGKIWSDEDLVVSNKVKTSSKETVITKGTSISNGYHIHVFSLSEDRRSAYIYLILATSEGIRYVAIDGNTI